MQIWQSSKPSLPSSVLRISHPFTVPINESHLLGKRPIALSWYRTRSARGSCLRQAPSGRVSMADVGRGTIENYNVT